MKRIKFMLLSLALVAVIGGALAFKAKYTSTFCTSLARQVGSNFTCQDAAAAALKCPNLVAAVTTTNVGAFYCTTTPQIDVNENPICPNTLNCISTAVFQTKGDGPGQ